MSAVECPSCSHVNTLGSNFCSSCGVHIGDVRDDRTDAISLADIETAGPGSDAADTPTSAASAESSSGASAEESSEDEDSAFDRSDFGPDMGVLFVQRGTKAGSRYALDNELTTAGRHPDSGIFLDDVTVSRRHAELSSDGATYVVRDLGSLNGTYVNRERIDEVALQDGDELQIGKFKLFFFHGTGS